MSETVTLPSGLTVELCVPGLRRLLAEKTAAGGVLGIVEVADACMDRACLPGDMLAEEDALYVACWAASRIGGDPETVEAVVFCERYGCLPSDYLGIADAVLGFEFDCHMTLAVEDARKKESDKKEGFHASAPTDGSAWFPREEDSD